ncbi:MAG: DUF805 domain-containing protein [Hyphomicrobiaceae bacterium]|nr:DUF805 domain-containing protein [Hyphomicrobiaceae bacterium]
MSDNQITWFYAENDGHKGPVTPEQIAELLAAGSLNEQTSVWSENMAGWEPLGQTPLGELVDKKAKVEPTESARDQLVQKMSTLTEKKPAEQQVEPEQQQLKQETKSEAVTPSASEGKQLYSVLAVGENLTDWQYFKRCVTVKYKRFGGRARRKEFWAFILFYSLFLTAALLLAMVIDSFLTGFGLALSFWGLDVPLATTVVTITGFFGFLLPYLAVFTRRMHDIELSGWYVLLSFFPLLGLIPFILALLPTRQTRANRGDHIYGPPPITQRID